MTPCLAGPPKRWRTRARGAAYVEVLIIVGVVLVLGLLAVKLLGQSSSEQAEKEATCIKSFACGSGSARGSGPQDVASMVGSPGAVQPAGAVGSPPTSRGALWQTGQFGMGILDGLGSLATGVGTLAFAATTPGIIYYQARGQSNPLVDTVSTLGRLAFYASPPGMVVTAITGNDPVGDLGRSIGNNVVTAFRENPARASGRAVFEVVAAFGPGAITKATGAAAEATQIARLERVAQAARAAEAERAIAATENLAAAERVAVAERLAAAERAAAAAKAAAAEKAAAEVAGPARGALERTWPEKWAPSAPGARVLSAQRRAGISEITGSVQGEVKTSIVNAKKAEIQAILDGAPGAPTHLPQVKVVPDPHNPGGYVIIDQNHTFQAYRELGFTEIPVQAYTESGVKWLTGQHSYNPEHYFPIRDMQSVEKFSGSPAEQLARRAAQRKGP